MAAEDGEERDALPSPEDADASWLKSLEVAEAGGGGCVLGDKSEGRWVTDGDFAREMDEEGGDDMA